MTRRRYLTCVVATVGWTLMLLGCRGHERLGSTDTCTTTAVQWIRAGDVAVCVDR